MPRSTLLSMAIASASWLTLACGRAQQAQVTDAASSASSSVAVPAGASGAPAPSAESFGRGQLEPSASAGSAAPSPMSERLEITVTRAFVEELYVRSNEDRLGAGPKIKPVQRDAGTAGLVLSGFDPDGPLKTLGLKNDDVITGIDGALLSPEGALRAYARLRTATRATLDIERQGRPFRLDIRVVEPARPRASAGSTLQHEMESAGEPR